MTAPRDLILSDGHLSAPPLRVGSAANKGSTLILEVFDPALDGFVAIDVCPQHHEDVLDRLQRILEPPPHVHAFLIPEGRCLPNQD